MSIEVRNVTKRFGQFTALAVVMLVVSFVLLLAINLLQWWAARRSGAGA